MIRSRPFFLILLVIVAAAILIAGCTTQAPSSVPTQKSSADTELAQADAAYAAANYHMAESFYHLAMENYTVAGNNAAAIKARDGAIRSFGMTAEFPYNRSAYEEALKAAYPNVSQEQLAGWIDGSGIASITSDNETWYYEENVGNVRYHNLDMMRNATAAMGQNPLFDPLTKYTSAPKNISAGPYGEPVAWIGTESVSVSRDQLPANGTLKIWFPVPIETGPQTNVTIISVEPAQYVKSQTGSGADIGIVYLEVPLEELNGSFLNVTATFRFVQHEEHFVVDPAKVLPYNTSDPEYRKYTASGRNIVITPAMKAKAKEIVGNETNPYLQAQKIYWHIVDTIPYSHAPHLQLATSGKPESEYVLETGIGDCGSQSMYFAALCRSLGIPARATGGYQIFPPANGGTHFWAEYYLEGYGWVPVDVTAAETADWAYDATDEERHQFKAYFFGSLDPYRYIIQKDVDIPLTPATGDAVLFDMVLQNPTAVCDTCLDDPQLLMIQNFTAVLKKA
ncbi:MAG: transglutaminase-like domain-containing protein [Methanoregula sp.]